MWHNIMPIGNTNCVAYMFAEIWSKSSIANPRLSECHKLNIVYSKINLWERYLFLEQTHLKDISVNI